MLMRRDELVALVESGTLIPGPAWPRSVKEHHERVRAIPCVITHYRFNTLHHCHGGSMIDLGWDSGGAGRKQSDALVIPLKAELHCAGLDGIDSGMGVDTWESWYGPQSGHLAAIGASLGYSLFELAAWWSVHSPKRGR